jgi:hypothetical protein
MDGMPHSQEFATSRKFAAQMPGEPKRLIYAPYFRERAVRIASSLRGESVGIFQTHGFSRMSMDSKFPPSGAYRGTALKCMRAESIRSGVSIVDKQRRGFS